jgi:ethanolamine utilization microcompartment shell protein EutL
MLGPGRRAAQALMVDDVTIARPGPLVLDPDTGDLVPATGATVYTGPGRLKMPSAVEVNRMFGGEDVTKTRFVLSVPHDVTDVAIGDVVTVTSSDSEAAQEIAYTVVLVPRETYELDRSFGLEAVE